LNRHRSSVPSLRWWIAEFSCFETVINYIDRQTLSILAPFLKQLSLTNRGYANIAIAFRDRLFHRTKPCAARLMDRVGHRARLDH